MRRTISIRQALGSLYWIIAGSLALIGLLFAGVGLYEAYQTYRQNAVCHSVRGTVIENRYLTTQDGTTISGAYHPVVEFKTAEGRLVRFTDGVGSLPADYAASDEVEVLYDPNKAEEARIKSWKRRWLVPTLLTGVGLLPLLVFVVWAGFRRSG